MLNLAQIVTRYRTVMMLCFALPFSYIFDRVVWILKWIKSLTKSKTKHQDRIDAICHRMKERELLDEKPLIVNARPSWLSLSTKFYKKSDKFQVQVGDLHHILGWSEKNQTIWVEPGVTVRDATDFLFPKGYSLAVHLEIDDATLGGLALGVGMTTASHKYGLLFETVESYEVVLPSGMCVEATADNEYSDLYHCLPWSHGSLGIVVGLTLKIAPMKKFVKMLYLPIVGQTEYCEKLREECGAMDPKATPETLPDFLEMTIFDKEHAVLMVGNMVDEVPAGGKMYHPDRWYQPFFFRHVEDVQKANEAKVEYIPTQEYLLRHQRGIFWVMELTMLPISNHWLVRYLLGWLYPIKPAFSKFTTTDGIRVLTFCKQVFQDITLPMTDLEESINFCTECFNIFPLLVYPCKEWRGHGQLRDPKEHQFAPGQDWAMFFDLGIYGIPDAIEKQEYYNPTNAMRKFEAFTRRVGGHPFLYADIFYTKEEFEECFDLAPYEKVRKKYGLNGAFPHLWNKVKPDVDVIKIGDDDWGRREC